MKYGLKRTLFFHPPVPAECQKHWLFAPKMDQPKVGILILTIKLFHAFFFFFFKLFSPLPASCFLLFIPSLPWSSKTTNGTRQKDTLSIAATSLHSRLPGSLNEYKVQAILLLKTSRYAPRSFIGFDFDIKSYTFQNVLNTDIHNSNIHTISKHANKALCNQVFRPLIFNML